MTLVLFETTARRRAKAGKVRDCVSPLLSKSQQLFIFPAASRAVCDHA
ncbi:hypothetical protein ASD8599_02005 [Ascidiaceihabitans donghaensis]|uniref:Uncharacterized protein n=1 Tax=Ascidiaceihabitans donghaensis TaxID=1510460 RepID=A0A2R8BDX3_9RHOB|nr:hypothetical protein ASD8599_02005 [Ascidiaceihabitans donghaensis]